jgi:hypothetical protein
MQALIIRTDNTEEEVTLTSANWVKELEPLIDSDCFDVVNLRIGKVMVADDNGYSRQRPINWLASILYWVTVGNEGWHIVGDVAILNDKDIENE